MSDVRMSADNGSQGQNATCDLTSRGSLDLNLAALNVIGRLVNVKGHPLNVHGDA